MTLTAEVTRPIICNAGFGNLHISNIRDLDLY